MQFTCSFAPVIKVYARRAFPIIIIVKIIPLADLFLLCIIEFNLISAADIKNSCKVFISVRPFLP